jgi:hypothetical protein
MIRLRSAFLIVLAGCVLAFFIGYQAGYLTARNDAAAHGLKKWVDSTVFVSDDIRTGAGGQ